MEEPSEGEGVDAGLVVVHAKFWQLGRAGILEPTRIGRSRSAIFVIAVLGDHRCGCGGCSIALADEAALMVAVEQVLGQHRLLLFRPVISKRAEDGNRHRPNSEYQHEAAAFSKLSHSNCKSTRFRLGRPLKVREHSMATEYLSTFRKCVISFNVWAKETSIKIWYFFWTACLGRCPLFNIFVEIHTRRMVADSDLMRKVDMSSIRKDI